MNSTVSTLYPFYIGVYKRKFKIVVEGNVCSHFYDSLYAARVALAQFKFSKDTANWTVEIIEFCYNQDGTTYVRQRLEGLLTNYGTEEVDVGEEIVKYGWIAVQWLFDKSTELGAAILEELFHAVVDIGVSLITNIVDLL